MEKNFNYVIQNKYKLGITREDQLLLYVKGKKKVKKSYMIYTLEMDFTLLNRRNNLAVISVLIKYAAKPIR